MPTSFTNIRLTMPVSLIFANEVGMAHLAMPHHAKKLAQNHAILKYFLLDRHSSLSSRKKIFIRWIPRDDHGVTNGAGHSDGGGSELGRREVVLVSML